MKRCILLSLLMVLFGTEQIFAKNHVINFAKKSPKNSRGWVGNSRPEVLRKWGLSQSMILVDDLSPVTNNWAAFVSNAGASVTFGNLNSSENYSLWVDFVKFRELSKTSINSRLKVYADGELITEIVFGKIAHDKLHKIAVPRQHTFDGKVTIRFEEIAAKKGVWGVWDIMLSNKYLPKEVKAADANGKKAKFIKKRLAKPKRKIVKKSSKRKKVKPQKKKSPKPIKKKRSKKPFESLEKTKKQKEDVIKSIENIRKKNSKGKRSDQDKKDPEIIDQEVKGPEINSPIEPKVPEVKFKKKENSDIKK